KPAAPAAAAPSTPGAPPAPARPPPQAAAPRPAAAPAAAPKPAAPPAPERTPEQELKDVTAAAAKLKDQNLFEVLGLNEKADAAQVKVAYFKMAKLFHPDTVAPNSPPELGKLKAEVF